MFRRYWIVVVLCFGTVAAAQPNAENEKLKEARQAYEQGDFVKSIELTTRIVAQNPKDHAAIYLRASSRVEHGAMRRDGKEIRDGIEDARESIKVGGGGEINYYMPYLFGMISLANLDQKTEHALVALEVAKSVLNRTNLTPEQRANVLYHRASAHLIIGDFTARSGDMEAGMKELNLGITDFQDAIKSFPGHLGSHMGLAEAYKESGQLDNVLKAYNSAVEVLPNNHLVYNNRGLFLQQQNRGSEAIADFNKAIDLDKNFATAYANRGYTLQGDGDLAAAEVDFTKALALEPNNPVFTSLRGTCRLAQGNAEGAVEDYTQAIRLNPENPVAHADLGFAMFFTRDYAAAYASFEQSSRIKAEMMRHLIPWKIWSLVLAGKPDNVDAIVSLSVKKTEKDRDWIDEQVLFLVGKGVSEKDLVDFVAKTEDPKLKNAELCEAYFFIAERRNQAGDKTTATAFYQQVIQTKEKQLSAYRGAQFALQAFGK